MLHAPSASAASHQRVASHIISRRIHAQTKIQTDKAYTTLSATAIRQASLPRISWNGTTMARQRLGLQTMLSMDTGGNAISAIASLAINTDLINTSIRPHTCPRSTTARRALAVRSLSPLQLSSTISRAKVVDSPSSRKFNAVWMDSSMHLERLPFDQTVDHKTVMVQKEFHIGGWTLSVRTLGELYSLLSGVHRNGAEKWSAR